MIQSLSCKETTGIDFLDNTEHYNEKNPTIHSRTCPNILLYLLGHITRTHLGLRDELKRNYASISYESACEHSE